MNPISFPAAESYDGYFYFMIYCSISVVVCILTRAKLAYSNPRGFNLLAGLLVLFWGCIGGILVFEQPSKPLLFCTLFFVIIFFAVNLMLVFAIYRPRPKMGFFESLFYDLFGGSKSPNVLDNQEE